MNKFFTQYKKISSYIKGEHFIFAVAELVLNLVLFYENPNYLSLNYTSDFIKQ